jgi:predicted DNA-binding transcriptional regulator YafY
MMTKMDNSNRIERLSYILTKLSYGEQLSTIKLAELFETTTRKIQLDFKEYILPLFEDETIYYDYSIKCYLSKVNFLQKTFLSSEELATIAILKAKSKDKYSDEDLSFKTNLLFEKLEDSLKNSIYENLSIESIEDNKIEIIQIKNAIKSKNEIECIYNEKKRKLYPLKILNLSSFWYLINYDLNYQEIRRYHLNSVTDIEILDNQFEFDEEIIKGFDNAINAYFEPHITPFVVELFLDEKVAKYFLRKPINATQRVLKTYDDGSLDIEVYITDFMEIVPLIQSYMPYVVVVSPDELSEIIKRNTSEYFRRIN